MTFATSKMIMKPKHQKTYINVSWFQLVQFGKHVSIKFSIFFVEFLHFFLQSFVFEFHIPLYPKYELISKHWTNEYNTSNRTISPVSEKYTIPVVRVNLKSLLNVELSKIQISHVHICLGSSVKCLHICTLKLQNLQFMCMKASVILHVHIQHLQFCLGPQCKGNAKDAQSNLGTELLCLLIILEFQLASRIIQIAGSF